VGSYSAKASDLQHVAIGDYEHDGYMPAGLGIGEGDYVEFEWCLECGQIQGEFPVQTPDVPSTEDE
jgi:hypothetical protein